MPELINYLTTIAKANHAKFVRIDPQIIDSQENNELLKNFGLIKASTNSQAEKKWILDLTPDLETLLNNMRKNTRYAIRKAEKQQIVTTFTTKVDEFTTFWELFVKTFNNKKFIPHPKSYYQKQIESFEESQSYRQYFSKAEDKLLCSALFMFYGQSVSYLHAATDNENRELFGAYDMIWTVIKDAKSKGYKYLDFWGIAPNDDPKHPWHGFTFFKKGFGGFELNIIRAYDKPVSWDYVLIRLIENLLQIWKRIYSKS
jgi:lipid II:glycine glycyltransferase (peptidoglycan interpeptide bridge formation enzyme)